MSPPRICPNDFTKRWRFLSRSRAKETRTSSGFKTSFEVSIFLWLLYSESVKSWGCQNYSCPMNSGKRSSACCRNPRGVVALGRIIAACWRAFSGCSRPARAGAICRRNIPAPALAGDACSSGKSRKSGWTCGDSFWPNWTRVDVWTGARASWTGVLLLPKRGRVRRQNQARQGHEVDGGGRRPRCSSGKAPGVGLARGSKIVGAHAGDRARAAGGTGPAQEPTVSGHRRQSLRQRPGAAGVETAWQRVDLSASPQPAAARAPRRTQTAALSQTLEGGAHLRLAGKLPSPGRAL